MGEAQQVASLMRWDTGREIAPESYARMRAHPRYPEAVRRYARNMLACGDEDPALDAMLKDAGRTMAAFSTAYLHASGGLTLPGLKELLAGFGVASPGRARALLIYLLYLGFAELTPVREPGKPAVHLPTARFLETYRDHQRAVADAVHVLEPAVGLMLDGFDAPGVFETFVQQMGDAFLDAVRQGHAHAAYDRVFMHRNAGIQIMHALLADAPGEAFPPEQAIPFSTSAAARRFKVSRVHVRRLLDAGEAESLLYLEDGAVRLTPEGREAVDWIFATQLIVFLTSAARTLKARPELLAAAGEVRVA